ncbi:MAG: tetratricopeptide repeat protein [Bryobacteraceae bacterium]
MRWSAVLSAVALLCTATAWTLRLGYADYLFSTGTRDGIERARRLAPGKAEYFARKAEGEDSSALARAVELNPYFSRGWIDLALEAELSGQPSRAERFLLEASRRDRSYLPRWSLANFYFRTGNREQFWVWARRAAEMGPYDQSALFELCWRMSGDAAEILAKAIPADPAILSQYVNYLLRNDRLEAARSAAEALSHLAGPAHRAAVLYTCDRLLAASRVREAIELWNRLAVRKLIPYPAFSITQTSPLTNGDFDWVPVAGGFDWKVPRVPGVSARGPGQPPGLRLDFSGAQPHRCELAAQALPMEGGQRYRVLYSYRTQGIRPETGLRWAVGPLGSEPGWWAQGPHLSREEWTEEGFEFLAPPGEQGVRLVLLYERAMGTTRIEGTLQMRRIQIRRVGPR